MTGLIAVELEYLPANERADSAVGTDTIEGEGCDWFVYIPLYHPRANESNTIFSVIIVNETDWQMHELYFEIEYKFQ